jgi:hypothetical protein
MILQQACLPPSGLTLIHSWRAALRRERLGCGHVLWLAVAVFHTCSGIVSVVAWCLFSCSVGGEVRVLCSVRVVDVGRVRTQGLELATATHQ